MDVEVARVAPGVHWHALEDDLVVGRAYAWHRPDRRVFVSVDTWRDDVFALLAGALAGDLERPLHTLVAADDREVLGRWSGAGFRDHRREHEYAIATDPAATGLGGAAPPPGITLITVDTADEDRLRALDERLRQDVPGTRGWVNSAEGFHRATFDPRLLDPRTYLVAVDGATGDYAGLVRIWRGRQPTLALVGVLPPHRRRGLARALLAAAFAPLHERGVGTVHAEADADDPAATALLRGVGAERTGGVVELILR